MLAVGALHWDCSEQPSTKPSKLAICAKCNEPIEVGALRLRPAGTVRTRFVHVECSKGILNSVNDIANLGDFEGAARQRLDRALEVARLVALAAGDVPHPDISDPQRDEIKPDHVIDYELKNLTSMLQIPWQEINSCQPLIRDVPPHWFFSCAEAKHAVSTSLLKHASIADPADRALASDRHWKLLGSIDAMLFHRPPKTRGGRKGQGAATLNKLFTERLRAFWAGDWLQLWIDVECTVMKSANSQKALSSPEAVDKRTVEVIDQYLERNAVSKAIARVAEPLHFASGSSVPSRLRSMFPKPMHAQPSQAPCDPVSDELKEALIAFIDKELQRLPVMCGGGGNGSFFEHLKIYSCIFGGTVTLARVLAQLLTGEAPADAVKRF